jgi:hypothetical protein
MVKHLFLYCRAETLKKHMVKQIFNGNMGYLTALNVCREKLMTRFFSLHSLCEIASGSCVSLLVQHGSILVFSQPSRIRNLNLPITADLFIFVSSTKTLLMSGYISPTSHNFFKQLFQQFSNIFKAMCLHNFYK